MFTHRIVKAANILRLTASWNGSRCFASTAAIDPAQKLLDGKAKIGDLSTQELKAALDYRNRSHNDCFDKKDLQKRLAGCIVHEFKEERRGEKAKKDEEEFHQRPENLRKRRAGHGEEAKKAEEELQHLEDAAVASSVHFMSNIPWVKFTLSTEITSSADSLLLLVPRWEYDRIEAVYKKHGAHKDPNIAARERNFLVQELAPERLAQILDRGIGPQDAKIGTAALLLYFYGNGEHIDKVAFPFEEQLYKATTTTAPVGNYLFVLPSLNPVPKNWTPELPPSSVQDRKDVLLAVQCARQVMGECDAIK